MVFQRPNPFPKSIYDNVAFGPRIMGRRKGLDEIVEGALVDAALWDEVKSKLKKSAFTLSGGASRPSRLRAELRSSFWNFIRPARPAFRMESTSAVSLKMRRTEE